MTDSPSEFFRVRLSPAQSRHLQPAIRQAEKLGDINAMPSPRWGYILIFPDYEAEFEAVKNTLKHLRAYASICRKVDAAILKALEQMEINRACSI